MHRSNLFLPTSRETHGRGTDTTQLLVRAGLIRPFGSGLWGFTPVGERIRQKVIHRLQTGMDSIGGQQVCLPSLQHRQRWEQSGRWKTFEGEMFTLENRDGQAMCLAPSHEEGMVHLIDGQIRSYDDLPLLVYQIESKFRDDHARNGLIRCKEFTMKDAYSFHANESSLDATYTDVRRAYERTLTDLGLEFAIVEADNSVMGGSASEEFIAPVEQGSVELLSCIAQECRFGTTEEHAQSEQYSASDSCPECGGQLAESDGIEVGHIFKLGTRYSAAMELTIDDPDGQAQEVLMGSYGLGVDRLIQTLVQQHGNANGCQWPVTSGGSVAPYHVAIIPIGGGESVHEVATDLHDACGATDVLLFDEESKSVGERFAESELLGIPAKVIVGNQYRETGQVEVEFQDGDSQLHLPEDVPATVAPFAAESECAISSK